MSLDDIVTYIAQVVADRAAAGNNFGTVLIPEGLIEFIPAMKRLIAELNDFLAANGDEFNSIKRSKQRDYIISKLSPEMLLSMLLCRKVLLASCLWTATRTETFRFL